MLEDSAYHIPRFLQVLQYLLAAYCKQNDIDLTKGIDLVVFEKIATFTLRFVNAYKTNLNSKTVLNFNSFHIVRSKHGRRVSRQIPTQRIFLPEIIETFKRNGLNRYLKIIKTDESRLISDPYNKVWTVDPSPSSISIDVRFNNEQKELITGLANCLKNLSEEELRAIGTHSNWKDVIEDIEKEFSDVLIHTTKDGQVKIINQCIDELQKDGQNPSFIETTKHLLSYMEEAYRKAVFNEKNYINAYKKLSDSFNISYKPEFKLAFEVCQSKPGLIWNKKLKSNMIYSKSEESFGLSLVLRYCAEFVNYPQKILKYNKLSLDEQKWYYERNWEDAVKLYNNKKVGIEISSYITEDGFEKQAKSQLLSSLENLKEWIKQNIPIAKYKYNYAQSEIDLQ